MADPIIQTEGSVSGFGTAGRDREGLQPAENIQLSDAEPGNVGSSYVWSLPDTPLGSAIVLNNPTTATPDFDLPPAGLEGSTKIRCEVDGTFIKEIIISVTLPNSGGRIPTFAEQLEYLGPLATNTKGWHEAMTVFMRSIDSLIGIPAAPTGPAGGDLSGTYPNPAVRALTTTLGPTQLLYGAINDGEFLRRVGGNIVSAVPTLNEVYQSGQAVTADQPSSVWTKTLEDNSSIIQLDRSAASGGPHSILGLVLNMSGAAAGTGSVGLTVNDGTPGTGILVSKTAGGYAFQVTLSNTAAQGALFDVQVPVANAVMRMQSSVSNTGAMIQIVKGPASSTLGALIDLVGNPNVNSPMLQFSGETTRGDIGLVLRTADPTNAAEGDFWYNTVDKVPKFHDGATVVSLATTFAGSVYERHASFGVPLNTVTTIEASLGRALFNGSVIGFDAHFADPTHARTAGTVTVNIKVGGATVMTGDIDAINTLSVFDTDTIGAQPVTALDEITVELVINNYDNGNGVQGALIVNVAINESTGIGADPNVAFINVRQNYTASQQTEQVTLVSGANVTVDCDLSNSFQLELSDANVQIDNPINVVPGQVFNIAIRQDSTGGRILTFDTAYKFGPSAPALPTGIGEEFMVSCYVRAVAVILTSRTEALS